jgi:outer membrane lipoprotein-sorting protein
MARTGYDDSDDLLQRAVAATRELPLPEGPSPAIASQTLVALRQKAHRPTSTLHERITHMSWKSKASAVLAIAASVLVMYVILSSPMSGTQAFAAVAQAINSVRTATWKIATEVKLSPEKTVSSSGVGMFLEPSHERVETTLDDGRVIQITDGAENKFLSLVPDEKLAMIFNVENVPLGRESGLGKTFQGLRDIVAQAQGGKNAMVERLDDEVVDGRDALVFRLQLGAMTTKIWADPVTLLPVRVEYTTDESRVVMSDFEIGVDLDESLFSLEVPEGYKLERTTEIDLSKKPITYLADALKLTAEYNNGVFPPQLRGEEGIDGMARRAAEALAKELANDPEELRRRTIEHSMTLGGAFGVLLNLSPEQHDYHYAGKDVLLNTPDQPIFWYRTSKASPNYEVLYADLHVEEVAPEDVPKVSEMEDAPNR